MKYGKNKHEQNVDFALSVTQQNIREQTGFMATELLHTLAILQRYCE